MFFLFWKCILFFIFLPLLFSYHISLCHEPETPLSYATWNSCKLISVSYRPIKTSVNWLLCIFECGINSIFQSHLSVLFFHFMIHWQEFVDGNFSGLLQHIIWHYHTVLNKDHHNCWPKLSLFCWWLHLCLSMFL